MSSFNLFMMLAQTLFAAESGYEIAKRAQEANEGTQGESSSTKMVLIDAHGTRTERKMEGKVLEGIDGDKSLSTFIFPEDVKGTKLLSWSHKNEDDDQWLFMPSLKRVKRIAGTGQTASFLGSEFSFEDLVPQEIEKFDYKLLREENLEGEPVWVLERRPKKSSGYSKQVVYMAKKYMNAIKVDYFDRKEELLKSASFSGYKEYKVGKKSVWRAEMVHMKNVQTRKESTFEWTDRKLGQTFKESDFDKNELD